MSKYYYIYVLRSNKDGKLYTGYTSNLLKRFNEHNTGLVSSTKNRTPFQLIYWERCLNQQDATHREKYLKSSWGKRFSKSRMSHFFSTILHPVR